MNKIQIKHIVDDSMCGIIEIEKDSFDESMQ